MASYCIPYVLCSKNFIILQYDFDEEAGVTTMKRNNAVKKTPHARSNSNGNIDYDDFPEVVPFLEAVSNHNIGIYKAPKKRYRKF